MICALIWVTGVEFVAHSRRVLSKSYSTKGLLYFGPLELNDVSASVEFILNPNATSSFPD